MADPFEPVFMETIRRGALVDRGRDYEARGHLFRFDFRDLAVTAAAAQVLWLSARTPPPAVADIEREIAEAVADGAERADLEARSMAYWANTFAFEPWLERVLPPAGGDDAAAYYSELWTLTLLRLELVRKALAAQGQLVTV